jgi:hypothetical protein
MLSSTIDPGRECQREHAVCARPSHCSYPNALLSGSRRVRDTDVRYGESTNMTTRTDTTDRRILTQQTTLSIALVGVILAATITGVWRAAVLSSDVTHLSGEVAELKVLVRVSAASYESSSTSNATAIQLIVERMKMDDGREEVDRKLFAEIQDRLVRLEGLVKE